AASPSPRPRPPRARAETPTNSRREQKGVPTVLRARRKPTKERRRPLHLSKANGCTAPTASSRPALSTDIGERANRVTSRKPTNGGRRPFRIGQRSPPIRRADWHSKDRNRKGRK